MEKTALKDFAVALFESYNSLCVVFELDVGEAFAFPVTLFQGDMDLESSAVIQQTVSTTKYEGEPISDKRDIY
jgi:hypothetical protein